MSREVSDLNPKVQELAQAFQDACQAQGLAVKIYFTFRTFEEQDALYAQGRTMPGKIVTNAKGGESYHCYRLAFDAAPLKDDLTIDWDDMKKYEKMAEIGESVGLESGLRWTKFKDAPHFQYTFGLSINDLKSGKRPPEE
jgi:peptidoglycan L-alanyl-D-glutamate endopeptidase CwlK